MKTYLKSIVTAAFALAAAFVTGSALADADMSLFNYCNTGYEVEGWRSCQQEGGGALNSETDNGVSIGGANIGGNFKRSFSKWVTTRLPEFATVDMAAKLGIEVPENVYVSGVANGAKTDGTITISGLDAEASYIIYAGCGHDNGNIGKSSCGFKVPLNGCSDVIALDYVVTVASSWGRSGSSTVVADSYTSFGFDESVCAGADGLALIRLNGIRPKSDGTINLVLTGERAGVNFIAIKRLPDADVTETTISAETVSVSDINNAPDFASCGPTNTVQVNLVGTKTFSFDEPLNFSVVKINLTGTLTLDAATKPEDFGKFNFKGVTGGVVYNWLELGTGMAINFHSGGNRALGNNDDAGIPRLKILGSCWNNNDGNNGELNAKMFSPDGTTVIAETMSISWTSKENYQWDAATSPIIKGYIDDGDNKATFAATVPFDRYDLYIIGGTDTANTTFSPKVVNGTKYTVNANGEAVPGSTGWGRTQTATPVLATSTSGNIMHLVGLTDPNLTISAPRENGRGGIAAIVIVKTHEVRNYDFDLEGDDHNWSTLGNWWIGEDPATELPTEYDTVTFPTSKRGYTVTLSEDVTVKAITMQSDLSSFTGGIITLADNGYGSTIMGTATLAFDGGLPDSSVEDDLQSTAWKGTVWLKNATGLGGIDFTKYGNSATTIKCTGVSGNFTGNKEFTGTVELENGEDGYALNIHDGSSNDGNVVTFDRLTGSGKILGDGGSTAGFLVKDWTDFTGDVVLTNKTVTFGDTKKANVNKIIINPGFAYTLVGQTWKANGGIQIDGTIAGTGTLASTAIFGLNATLDAATTNLAVNTLPTFALTNRFLVSAAPTADAPVKVLSAAEGVTLAPKTFDVVPEIVVGGEKVEGTFQVRSAADGIYLEKVSGTFQIEKSDLTVTASGLNANELASADGSSIVTITLTGENPTLVLDESIKGGDLKIIHEGGLTIAADAEPADLSRYDLRGVTGFIRYSWLAMKRVVNLNFRDSSGKFEADDLTTNDGLLAGNTPKASWINLGNDASNDGVLITNVWNAGTSAEEAIEGLTVGWKAKTVYAAQHDIPVMKGYLDDGDANWPDGVTITLKDVPFEAYDVIVYYNTDMDNRVYPPVKVNGVAYTWDGEAGKTVFGTNNWGRTRYDGVAYGDNALRISNLSGDAKITTAPRDNSQNLRGCVPAIQIVEVEKKANSFVADTDTDVLISELNKIVPEGYTDAFTVTLNGGDLIYDTEFVCGALFVNSTAAMTITTGGAEISDAELAKINLAEVDGVVTFEIPRVPLATSSNGAVYTVGVGTEDTPTSLVYPVENGSMTIRDGVFYLDATAGGATSTVSFVDATIFATNGQGLAVGMANFTLSGATTVTAKKVILSEGDDDRVASLTLNDTAKIIVTGETIADQNTSSILFGHWNGPSTFTMNGNAEFLATNAQVLVGKTSNNHTINLNGGTFVAKGIKASSSANLTNTLNLAGTTLYLGEAGISSYSANTKIDVNVLENTTIYATDPTFALTQPITIADGKTLTIIAEAVNFGELRDFTYVGEHFDLTEVEALGLTATLEEYGAGKATIIGIPEKFDKVYFEANGEMIELAVEDGKAIYDVEPHIAGEVCWYDFTFTNTVTTAVGSQVEATLNCDHTAEYVTAGDDTAIKTYAWPWHLVPGLENLDNYAVTFVATMPKTLRTTAFYIGNDVADAGIQFATGNVKDEILVNYVTTTEVREITTLTVPNASEAYHFYLIAKIDDHTFVVYLDGLKWKTIATDYDIRTIKGGMQFGSDYGGRLQRLANTNPQYYTNVKEDDPSAFKFLRIYNRLLSEPEIAAYQELYPYVDPNGASTRTLTAEDESWIYLDETAPWTYAKSGEEGRQLSRPEVGGAINLIENSSSMVTLTNNLWAVESYSSITVTGSKGIRFVLEDAANPAPIMIAGLVTIGAPVEVEYGALDISGAPLMLGEAGAITFDCTGFAYGGVYGEKFIQLTGETDELPEGKVVIIPPEPASGLRAEGLYDEARRAYGLKVTVDRDAMRLFVPAGSTVLTDDTWYETEAGGETFRRLRADDEVVLRSEETLAITNAALTLPLRKLTVEGTESMPASLKLAPGWNYTDTVVVGTNGTYDVDGQDNNAVNLVLNGGTLANTGASTVLNHIGAWKISVAADSTVNVPLAEDEESRVLHSLASGYGVFDYNLNTNTLTKTGAGEYCIVNGRFNSGKLVVAEGTLTIDTLVVTNGEDLAVDVRDGAWLWTVNGDSRVSSIGGTVDYELLTPATRFEDGAKIRFSGANYFKSCEQWTLAEGAKVTLDAVDGATFRWFKPIGTDSEMFFPNAAAVTMTPAFKRMMLNSDYKIIEQDGRLVISRKPKFLMILK